MKATIRELTRQAAGPKAYQKRQAPQQPAALLFELERMVVDETIPKYEHAYAWVKLVTYWAVLRGEGSTWVEAKTLRWDGKIGLHADSSASRKRLGLTRGSRLGPSKCHLKRFS